MISYDQLRHFCFYVLSKSSPYRINVCDLMARSYVKSCKHFHVSRCAQMCFNKKYNQIEIILYSYIIQYRSFDLSNIRRIMGISTNDYTNLIATVQGASSYIASRWPKYVELCHLLNNKSTTFPSVQKRECELKRCNQEDIFFEADKPEQ